MELLTIIGISALSHLGGLAGGFLLIWREQFAYRFASYLISLAAGALLGVAFLDLLPEAIAEGGGPSRMLTYTLIGIVLFFLIEKLLLWRHHAHGETQGSESQRAYASEGHMEHAAIGRGKAIRPLVLFGDGLHNFLDGATIAITFAINPSLGLLTALAVLFHELPHNLSDFAILLHTNMPRRQIGWWNVGLAFASPLGALVAFTTVNTIESLLLPLLALTAGNFIYLATVDLIPEINREQQPGRILGQILLLIVGILLVWQLGVVLPEGM